MRLMTKPLVLLLCMALMASTGIGLSAEKSATQQKPDVRVLIDISGSMKKNDPKNLRVPALQLITNLLPKNSDAGVWAFGRYVNMMVPLGQVDKQWQAKATKAATKINSLGLYTNIGGVLEKASYGWSRADKKEKRSMILLTDGMVDISKDAAVNAKERERILKVLLPRLKAGGVSVHTIALSDNADHQLMKTLSRQTDGWYEKVDNAAELEKVFLKIFEQATERDSLPLVDNQFTVDASIEEMTVLVFKKPGADKAELISPQNQIINAATKDGSVRWFSSNSYDLITVEKPATGGWAINAEVDPDNRVMVVSNLALDVSPVPNNLLAGEAINYQFRLLEKGKLITRPQFLKLVNARLKTRTDNKSNVLAMFFDSAESAWKQNFFSSVDEGVLNLRLEVKSPTFERIRTHAINIYGSPLVDNLTLSDSIAQPHLLTFAIRDDIVQPESLTVNLVITQPDQEKQFITLKQFDSPVEIKPFDAGGHYTVALEVSGQSVTGREFKITPQEIEFDAPATTEYLAQQASSTAPEPVKEPESDSEAQQPKEEEPVKEEPVKEEPKAEVKPQPQPKEPEPVIEQSPAETGLATMTWIYIGVGINLLFGIGGFFGWRWWKNRQTNANELLADELGLDDIEEDAEEADADESADEAEEVIELEDDDDEK